MLQIVNITEARNNLAKLLQKVKSTKEPIIIVQDSIPTAVLYPYDEIVKKEEERERAFRDRFQEIFKEGRKVFTEYLEKQDLPTPTSEEEAYTIIKNA